MRTSIGRALGTVAVTGVALAGPGAGAVSAGEITGNGTLKPVNGASECAYSGQNDGFHIPELAHDDLDASMRVQSFGQIHRMFGLPKGLPGTACNPTGGRG